MSESSKAFYMLLSEDSTAKSRFSELSSAEKEDILHRASNIVTLSGLKRLINYRLY